MSTPPRATHNRARTSTVVLVAGLLLILGSEAAAESPPADWHPIEMVAVRSGVQVAPIYKSGANGSTAQIQIANTNPFPIVIADVVIPHRDPQSNLVFTLPGRRHLKADERLLLTAKRDRMALDGRGIGGIKGIAQIRFGLLADESYLVALDNLREGLDYQVYPSQGTPPEEAVTSLGRPVIEDAASLLAMSRILRFESRLASVWRFKHAGELTTQARRSNDLSRDLSPLACASGGARLTQRMDAHDPKAVERFKAIWTLAELHGPELLDCLRRDIDTMSMVVSRAMAEGDLALASRVSQSFVDGENTPEPFKSALVEHGMMDYASALASHDASLNLYDLARALDAIMVVDGFRSGVRTTTEILLLADHVKVRAAHHIEREDFDRADQAMALYAKVLRAAAWSAQQSEHAEAIATHIRDNAALASELAYTHGRFVFHYRRARPGMLDAARTSFIEAEAHAPIRSKLYLAAVSVVEHQFLTLLFVLLGIAGVWLTVRGQAWARLRLRMELAWASRRARRSPHRAAESAWKVVSKMMALQDGPSANAKVRAKAAARLLDMGHKTDDPQLMNEAASHLGRVRRQDRPENWRSPEVAAHSIAAALDGPLDHAALAVLERTGHVATSVFDPCAATRAVEGFLAEARCRVLATSGADRTAVEAAYTDAIDRLAMVDGDGPLAMLVQTRLGMLEAAVGPALTDDPQVAWSKAWQNLSGQIAPSSADSAGLKSLAMAAAAGADALSAAEVLEASADRLAATEEGLAVLREALLTASARARLPLPEPQQGPEALIEAHREALLALARLDNLLTDWVEPAEALDARLGLAILRRIGGAYSGQHATDVEYLEDRQALFEQAQRHRARPSTAALASVLDLLTEGDWGFDADVARAQGSERSLYLLMEALDHSAHGRHIEAASVLASADPDDPATGEGRAVRLLCARAIVAQGLGRGKAALEALKKASDRAMTEASGALVDRTAARLMGLVLKAQDQPAWDDLLERSVKGALSATKLPSAACPWHTLSMLLARCGREQTAQLALERSMAVEHGPEATSGRRDTARILARLALARGDYSRARYYVMLEGRTRVSSPH